MLMFPAKTAKSGISVNIITTATLDIDRLREPKLINSIILLDLMDIFKV